MAIQRVFVGDVGTVFEATLKEVGVVVNISSATAKQLIFERPDGSTFTVTASFTIDGTDGKLQYTILVGDLNIAGLWSWQAKVTLASGGPFHSETKEFRAVPVLA